MPKIEPILNGKSKPKFPKDISSQYALTCALSVRSKNMDHYKNAFLYLSEKASMEWLNQCAYEASSICAANGDSKALIDVVTQNKELMKVAERLTNLLNA
ncbi:MAG TPA: hypothetical protein D7H86_03105 [Candidatus Poseidoniales archaeon]|nr:MAG TPA: hypothetical protein D7H86_03105 [Candidatus Poseidoniales archaeon]